jgi:hypothetical protein
MQKDEIKSFISYFRQKLKCTKCTKDLNVRAKTIKLLGKNIGVTLPDLELGNGFLNMTSKKQAPKGEEISSK